MNLNERALMILRELLNEYKIAVLVRLKGGVKLEITNEDYVARICRNTVFLGKKAFILNDDELRYVILHEIMHLRYPVDDDFFMSLLKEIEPRAEELHKRVLEKTLKY